MDFYWLDTQYLVLCRKKKTWKKTSRKSRIRWDTTWWRYFNIRMTSRVDVGPACGCFFLSLRLVRVCEIEISCTTDQDFHCFNQCGIFLSHTPVPALGKDKNRTAARRPHAGCTTISDVIVILKWRRHVALQRIQDFLEDFIMFFLNIKCGT